MALRFSVLASSSAGNASYLEADGFGVLIDFGLAPKTLARRLDQVFASWESVRAALLTHTHGDHWNDGTLKCLHERGIPIHCMPEHVEELKRANRRAEAMESEGLLRPYQDGELFDLETIRVMPFAVPHDGPTSGFRIEGVRQAWSLAYATDLGSWNASLVSCFADVDILALEFNHDVELERSSGRHAFLVNRVLGHRGHLSNDSAATLLGRTLEASADARLSHVVLTHLSQQCNSPSLAREAAERIRAKHQRDFEIHVATPNAPTVCMAPRRAGKRFESMPPAFQQLLPGWDE
ncbi:MAG: MBL fold metallo-hydrolase [Gemmataceae bacterium]